MNKTILDLRITHSSYTDHEDHVGVGQGITPSVLRTSPPNTTIEIWDAKKAIATSDLGESVQRKLAERIEYKNEYFY